MFFKLFQKIHALLFGRNLGRIPGARKLHSFLYNFVRPVGEIKTETNGFTIFLNSSDEGEAKDILLKGIYDELETEVIKTYVKKGDYVLDIGAHIGYFCLLMAREVGESGRVYAFEPEPKNFKFLSKNIEINKYSNVVLENLALSSTSGKVKLFLDKNNLGNMSFSSLNIPQKSLSGYIEVKSMALDEYVNKIGNKISFIKIDVQGAEGLVFSGAWQTLRRSKPVILIEFWPYGLKNNGTDPMGLLAMLHNLGYKFFVLDVKDQKLKSKNPIDIMNVSRNREENKGWANILCQI